MQELNNRDEATLPLKIEGISENLYGGFWLRLWSIFLDTLCNIPLFYLSIFIESTHVYFYVVSNFICLLFGIWYSIYLPKKYGGTPGKLMVGIKILKLNGDSIGWKEAILRHSIDMIFGLFGILILIYSVSEADNSIYLSKSREDRFEYLSSFTPILSQINLWAVGIWMCSELIFLLFNERRRAVHDFIAGTVIVKSKYIVAMKDSMTSRISE